MPTSGPARDGQVGLGVDLVVPRLVVGLVGQLERQVELGHDLGDRTLVKRSVGVAGYERGPVNAA